MDVYCPKCAEPVDMDYFHDVAAETETTYAVVAGNFRAVGCSAVGFTCSERDTSGRAAASSALMDLMGDDMDGVAAMLEDAEYMGMF